MKTGRVFLFAIVLTTIAGCNRASWGSSSGGEAYYDPNAPDYEAPPAQTEGSYTPLNTDEDTASDD